MSVSSMRSESPLVFHTAPNADSEEWTAAWRGVLAKGAFFLGFGVCFSVSCAVGGHAAFHVEKCLLM